MKTIHAALLGLVVVATATTAFADNCKSPKVKVVNDKAETIKVTKIQYFDGCDSRWRTEDVASTEIRSGSSATFTDNLEYVGNCKVTKFKLYRAVRKQTGDAYSAFEWGASSFPTKARTRCATPT